MLALSTEHNYNGFIRVGSLRQVLPKWGVVWQTKANAAVADPHPLNEGIPSLTACML